MQSIFHNSIHMSSFLSYFLQFLHTYFGDATKPTNSKNGNFIMLLHFTHILVTTLYNILLPPGIFSSKLALEIQPMFKSAS